MEPVISPDELRGDSDLVISSLYTALQNVLDVEFRPYLRNRLVFSLNENEDVRAATRKSGSCASM